MNTYNCFTHNYAENQKVLATRSQSSQRRSNATSSGGTVVSEADKIAARLAACKFYK
jgi:hypothetical protein